MKKLLLLPLVLLALFAFSQETLPLDTRLIKNGCNFPTKDKADLAAHHASIMPDETITDIVISKNANGTYCSWSVATCNAQPLSRDIIVKYLDTEGVNIKEVEIIHVYPAPSPIPTARRLFDVRKVNQCFATESQRNTFAVQTKQSILGDEYLNSDLEYTSQSGQYCYKAVIGCASIPLEPGGVTANIPALAPNTSCTKTLYGPNIFVAYPSCQEAENGAASWLQGKTSVILESVEPYVWSSPEGFENWGVKIKYMTSGSCYK